MVTSGRKWVKYMFVGESEHSLDDKFRLVLPAKFREAFGQQFFAFIDFDHCISFYDQQGYDKRAGQILSLSEFSLDARKLKRTFFGNSLKLCLDKVGRVLLPKAFLEKAGITKDVVLIGVYDHLELWDKTIYAEEKQKDEADYLSLAEKLARSE